MPSEPAHDDALTPPPPTRHASQDGSGPSLAAVPSSPDPTASAHGTSVGLDPHLLGLLAYAFGWVSGLVLLLVEKEDRRVRFHAAQSLVLSLGLMVVWVGVSVLSFVPVLGIVVGLLGLLLGVAAFGLWVVLLVQGYRLAELRLPVVASIADDVAARVGS